MNSVKANVRDLLQHLRKNHEKHIADYADAVTGYKLAMVSYLSNALRMAKAGEEVSHLIDVVKPVSYESDYTKAIAMLAWTTDKEIVLSSSDFSKYVLDEWSWKESFSTVASLYKAAAGIPV